MLVSPGEELIEHARTLATQARDPAPHYQHSEIGYNYRMSNVLAAIGRRQLQVLAERVRRKREIFQFYADTIGDLPGITPGIRGQASGDRRQGSGVREYPSFLTSAFRHGAERGGTGAGGWGGAGDRGRRYTLTAYADLSGSVSLSVENVCTTCAVRTQCDTCPTPARQGLKPAG